MCTRVLWIDNNLAVFFARSMDWPESTEPFLTVFPRGAKRHGGRLGDEIVIPENALEWTSRFGTIVTTVYGLGAADGLNEKGLACHMLAFQAADFGDRDVERPGVQAGLWLQYLLDNAANVSDAIALHNTLQIVLVSHRGFPAAVHLAIEDASGDSAVIEYLEGQLVVHHGRQFTVMTNDPDYDTQLELLSQLDFSQPSSDMPLPGNVNPRDRFQRATYYRDLLPEPQNERDGIAGVLAVVRNVSVPFGAPYRGYGIYNTEYRTAANLNDCNYYFELSNSPSTIWTNLDSFDLAETASVMTLDPKDISLCGDVSSQFESVEPPY